MENCAMNRASFGGPAKAETERQIGVIEEFLKERADEA